MSLYVYNCFVLVQWKRLRQHKVKGKYKSNKVALREKKKKGGTGKFKSPEAFPS